MAAQKNWPPLKVLDHLFDLELETRRQSKIALRLKQSKLLEKPTIYQFDFHFHNSRKKQKGQILQLLNLDFINHKKDIILIGNPGVGKSYLAKIIAYAATQNSIKVLFTTAMDLINHLVAAEVDHSLLKNSTFTSHRIYSLLMRSLICRWAHKAQMMNVNYNSRLTTIKIPGIKN